MHGEADYALANAWQSLIVAEFSARHPACRCLSVEWSVWSGVGMGERLGRIEALISEGISPIRPTQGVDMLRRLLSVKLPCNSVIVTGRLGELPTLKFERPELPFLRFLERSKLYYPGVELIVDNDLSSESDPYLQDHVFQGEQILPGVIGLEAMAQVAMALSGKPFPPSFEQVEFLHPLVVNRDEKVTLRIAALARSGTRVEVLIRCSKTHYQMDHFRALCVFEKASIDGFNAIPSTFYSAEMPIDPKTELYGSLFFHSGRFVHVSRYHFYNAWQCSAEIESSQTGNWFSRYSPQTLVLGDPGARDAALHAIQACIPHSVLVPIGIEKLLVDNAGASATWTVNAKERSHEQGIFVYDLEIIGIDGERREYWQGLKLKVIAKQHHENWLEALLPPFLERQIETMAATKVNVALVRGPLAGRTQRSDAAIQQALGKTLEIVRRADGKPYVLTGQCVSAAHVGELTLAVACPKVVSCDMEQVTERDSDFWHTVFAAERLELLALLTQRPSAENYNLSASRIWTLQECLKKADLPPDTPITIQSEGDSGWITFVAGEYLIGSFIAQLRQTPEKLALAVLVETGGLKQSDA